MSTVAETRPPKPRYARFWKADLQMQTPVDTRHWCGQAGRLTHNATPDEILASARAYATRCYEVGLEIWGLTDHNLGGDSAKLYHDALKTAIEELAPVHQWRPVIFPGFEVEANVGKGLHLLCLFDPAVAFDDLDDVLTDLGLPRKSRFIKGKPIPLQKSLDKVLDCVQDKHGGLVIAAHPDSFKGALSDDDLAKWLSVSVITNERLLCMELRQGREAHTSASGTLGAVVRNDDGEWHRSHPIAVVTSSDCKKLTADDGSGDESWIGKRFSWLKMSDRSIEGLRQAFLDHESRIAFEETNPDHIADHPRIERIQINGVDFLVDLDVSMSPNLTTLIGGGGTGKSTILEYCRAALQQTISDQKSDVAKNHQGIAATVGKGQVELTLSHGSSLIVACVSADGADAADDTGEPISKLGIRFPATVLGQREVYAIAGSQAEIRSFVDRIDADALRSLKHDEDGLRAKAIELGELLDLAAEHEMRRSELSDERRRMLEDVGLETSISGDEISPEDALRETAAVRRVDDAIMDRAQQITELADEVALPMQSPDVPPGSGHEKRIRAYVKEASAKLAQSAEELREISRSLAEFRALERDLPREFEIPESWLSKEGNDGADSSLETITQLVSRLQEFDEQIDRLRADTVRLRAGASARSGYLAELREVWEKQISVRRRIAMNLRDLVPETGTGEPFVEVSVVPFGHRPDLEDAISEHVDDNRRFSSGDVADLVKVVYSASPDATNPTAVLCDWLRSLPDNVPDELESFSSARLAALVDSFGDSAIRRLETSRPSDSISVMLRRGDGSVAGTLDHGLSVGQKCTAILALALAEGTFPILIDQPEDEIDNEFIYQNLVPLLRRAKQRRQVIVATHDPNLPVNGDAELIVALEARSESGESARGRVKELPEGRCIGSLDRKPVKLAVEEIMEGSKEAFLRRHVRYGF